MGRINKIIIIELNLASPKERHKINVFDNP